MVSIFVTMIDRVHVCEMFITYRVTWTSLNLKNKDCSRKRFFAWLKTWICHVWCLSMRGLVIGEFQLLVDFFDPYSSLTAFRSILFAKPRERKDRSKRSQRLHSVPSCFSVIYYVHRIFLNNFWIISVNSKQKFLRLTYVSRHMDKNILWRKYIIANLHVRY